MHKMPLAHNMLSEHPTSHDVVAGYHMIRNTHVENVDLHDWVQDHKNAETIHKALVEAFEKHKEDEATPK